MPQHSFTKSPTPNINLLHAQYPSLAHTALRLTLLTLFLATHNIQCQKSCPVQSKNLTVGILVPFTGVAIVRRDMVQKAVEYIVDKLNKERAVLGYTLDYKFYDTECHPGTALSHIAKARTDGVVAFVGPACGRSCLPAGRFAQELNLTVVTYACQSTMLSFNPIFPNVARIVSTFMETGRFVVAIISHFGWKRVLLVLNSASARDWLELIDEVDRSSKVHVHKEWVADMSNSTTLAEDLKVQMKHFYVFVLCMYPSEALTFLRHARQEGWYTEGRAYFTFHFTVVGHLEPTFTGLLDITEQVSLDASAFKRMLQYINPCHEATITPSITLDRNIRSLLHHMCSTSGSRFRFDLERLEALCGLPCFSLKEDVLDREVLRRGLCGRVSSVTVEDVCERPRAREEKQAIVAAMIADSVQLVARGLKAAASISCPYDPSADTAHIVFDGMTARRPTLQGITGSVSILEDGARLSTLLLRNFGHQDYTVIAAAHFEKDPAGSVYYDTAAEIVWPGGGKQVPSCPDSVCPRVHSSKFTKNALLLGGVTALCIVVFAVSAFIPFLMVKRRHHLATKKDWIISSQKLYSAPAFSGKIGKITGGRHFRMRTTGGNVSAMDLKHSSDMNLSHDSLHTYVMGQIFTRVTILDQQVVAIKRVEKDSVEVTPDVIIEMIKMRRLKHANVNQLVGACVDPGNVCLVWGYCAKGSLRDVLDNEDIKLDWMFKLSFVTDISRGMNYLHSSPVQLHGRLKSTNVLVDTNWCCKITDMSMPHFREGQHDVVPPAQYYYSLLWTAPELLRKPLMAELGTRKGDIYSYAIIVHEVYDRCRPYHIEQGVDPKSVVYRVEAEEKPPFRPIMSSAEDPDSVDHCIKEAIRDMALMCWDECPLFRPNFSIIAQNLRNTQQAFGGAPNLVDQMLMMLRKYADNLEELVEERTRQVEVEQKKTEDLLSRMLPKTVAEELKMGRPVIPECYASATLFFSDILHFSNITHVSTPMQVVNLLNDLYTCFDKVIETYDAYKVETIADNYVVSSGLPIRNGNRHAAVIATLALDLLVNVLSFSIRHLPDQQLLLRIGIHTGSVVAGVVGKKMPRYCLFGDTVNYTSRVESNGKPLHIHVSPECKKCLDNLGGFHLRERGLVNMKGKGEILTYFLVGKDGFECNVPKLRPGVFNMVGINITIEKYFSPASVSKEPNEQPIKECSSQSMTDTSSADVTGGLQKAWQLFDSSEIEM